MSTVKRRKAEASTVNYDPKKKVGRKEITAKLTQACVYYWIKKLYSVHPEIGVEAWGRRRIDVMALNTKAEIVGIEVKSCPADYSSDTKWHDYLPYVNRFYFLISEKMYRSKFYDRIVADVKPHGVGIMVLNELSGRVEVVRSAKKKRMEDTTAKKKMILKMAWRGGLSRYNTKRVQRVHIYD